jgi:hypothetical protein
MAERIASGEIDINVNDEKALADLRRIDAEFDRAMSRMDGKKAEADIRVNLKELKADLDKAAAELKKFDANADKNAKANAKSRVAELKQQVKGQQELLDKQREANRTADARVKIEQELEKRTRARTKVMEDASRRELANAKQTMRAKTQAMALQEREIANVNRYRRQLAEAAVTLDKLAKARRKATDEKIELAIDMNIAETEAKMVALKQTLQRLGSPLDIDVNIRPGHHAGQQIRDAFNNRGILGAAESAGLQIGDSVMRGMRKRMSKQSLANTFQGVGQKLGSVFGNISTATARIGPFTATIRQIGLALAVLGPTILDVIGALGSLVSVAGAALAGVGALTAGFVGGLVPTMIGFLGVIKPMVTQFKQAKKASDAYNKAVLEHGKGSAEAAKKEKILQSVLKGTDQSTVEAFKSMQKLSSQWLKLTAPARAAGMNVIGDAINFASHNMDWFAKRTNTAFKTATDGVRGWIKGLGSAEGRNILGNLMGNFNKMLGPVLHGLGQIGVWFGRIASAASNFLPAIGQGFDTWASKLADSVKDGAKLQATLTRLMGAAKSVGQFFMAAGRFLVSFFNPGVEAGQRLTDTMTNALNRWTALNKAAGGSKLAAFFQQSVTGAQNLYAAFAPLLASFVRWAALMAPAVSGFLRGAAAVSRFTASVASMLQLGGGVQTLAATLGALWAVGKISAAARAVAGFGAALAGVRTASAGAAASGGIGALLGGGGKGAAKAAGEITLMRRAATLAVPAIAEMGTVMAGATTLGVAVIAGAAAYGAYKFLTMKSSADKLKSAISDSVKPMKDMNAAMAVGANASVQAGVAQRQYGIEVNHVAAYKAKLARLESQGKKNTDDYRNTVQQLNQALLSRGNAEAARNKAFGEASKSQQAMTKASNNLLAVEKNLNEAKKEHKKWQDLTNQSDTQVNRDHLAEATDNLTRAQNAYNDKLLLQRAAAQQAAVNALNYQRAVRGLIPAAGAAAAALGKLYQRNAKVAQTIAVKYQDPKDAGAVAQRANAALKAGVKGNIVTKIIADSSSADQAIRRLRSVKDIQVNLKVAQQGGVAAVAMLERIKGTKLTEKQQKVAMQGGAPAIALLMRLQGIRLTPKQSKTIEKGGAAAIQMLARIIGIRIPTKTATVRANVGDALAGISSVLARMGQLQNKSVYIDTYIRTHGSATPGGSTGTGKGGASRPGQQASGRGPGGSQLAWVGEGHNWQGSPELIADHKTGDVTRVDSPTLMNLSPSMAVIPNESRYRHRGRSLWADFAGRFGLDTAFPRFAASKKPTATNTPTHRRGRTKLPLTPYGKAQARKSAMAKIEKHGWKSQRGKPYMDAVETAKQNEQDQEFEIGRAEGKLKEPNSFIKVVGQDANGDDLFAIDQDAINSWAGQLDSIRAMYDKLMELINGTSAAIDTAANVMTTIVGTATSNKAALQKQMATQKGIMNGKHTSKSEKQAAAERYKLYKSQYEDEDKALTDAFSDRHDLVSEKHDVGQRYLLAQDKRDEYAADRDAVQGKAEADAAASQPKPEKPGTSDTGAAGGTAADISPDQQAALDQAKANAVTAFRAQGIAEGALAAFTGVGDLGVGGSSAYAAVLAGSSMGARPLGGGAAGAAVTSSSVAAGAMAPSGIASAAPVGFSGAGGGATIININTLHPGDPDTLRAVGAAATAGQGLQGYRPTTRFGTGY